MPLRGFLIGVLTLSLLDVVLSSQLSASNASLVLQIPATIAQHVISPFEPAVPDLRKHRSGGATGADNPYAQAQANIQAISATYQAQNTPAAPSSAGNVGIEA